MDAGPPIPRRPRPTATSPRSLAHFRPALTTQHDLDQDRRTATPSDCITIPSFNPRTARSAVTNGSLCRWEGQAWTDMAALARDHRLVWRDDAGVLGIGMEPSFAIGQRALLIEEPDGCILWDCTSLVTPDIIDAIGSRGGLKAIAISHPHFYSAMVEWSEAFGGVPIYLHADDRPVGHAPKPVDRVLGRRHAPAVGCRDADPLRRTFRGRHRAALGGAARPVPARCSPATLRPRDDGPGACQLHVQFSQPHSARRGGRPAHRVGN